LAKRLGVSEEQLAELGNSETTKLSEREKTALRLAEQVTLNSTAISDAFFENLKTYFTDGAILELVAVIGIFNYFNRFNNALKMDITQ
jgi:alkylhydroperoxidase family enzyme